MKTVKQVSELTGISVRTLHYYDEIGLFRPSEVTESGYRLYDEDALETLQQILFFKELDFSLKDIKWIMTSPNYDKKKTLENQKKLIQAKRDRLDRILDLLDKLIKGEKCMSFKEFDMSEYFQALDEFKEKYPKEVIKHWGSMDEFEAMINGLKSNEAEIAQMAEIQYGCTEDNIKAMKENLQNFSDKMESLNVPKDQADAYLKRSDEIMTKLLSDLTKDPTSNEI